MGRPQQIFWTGAVFPHLTQRNPAMVDLRPPRLRAAR
jgi:hypothetical protein